MIGLEKHVVDDLNYISAKLHAIAILIEDILQDALGDKGRDGVMLILSDQEARLDAISDKMMDEAEAEDDKNSSDRS